MITKKGFGAFWWPAVISRFFLMNNRSVFIMDLCSDLLWICFPWERSSDWIKNSTTMIIDLQQTKSRFLSPPITCIPGTHNEASDVFREYRLYIFLSHKIPHFLLVLFFNFTNPSPSIQSPTHQQHENHHEQHAPPFFSCKLPKTMIN